MVLDQCKYIYFMFSCLFPRIHDHVLLVAEIFIFNQKVSTCHIEQC